MKLSIMSIIIITFLAGCKNDRTPETTQIKYYALANAYRLCVGSDGDTYQLRLECTRAIYGLLINE